MFTRVCVCVQTKVIYIYRERKKICWNYLKGMKQLFREHFIFLQDLLKRFRLVPDIALCKSWQQNALETLQHSCEAPGTVFAKARPARIKKKKAHR